MMRRGTAQNNGVETIVAIREQIWASCLLAWVAAFSDAIGFIVLQQLGASYMSGNSMSAGIAIGRADWQSAINHGLPIFSFLTGILLGNMVLRAARRRVVRSSFGIIFGLEAVCVFAFFIAGSHALQNGAIHSSETGVFYLCLILLTLAMGLQTATLRKIMNQSVRTTFVTGVLSDAADAFLSYLSWLRAQAKERGFRQTAKESLQQSSLRKFLLLGGIWSCYIFGAICGSFAEGRLSLTALFLPIGVLVALIIVDLARPFESSNPG
jgi:uncharacterized membrane protein YoaK (UPF0700 family)